MTLVETHTRCPFEIVEERHVSPATRDPQGNPQPERRFAYAIRRRDDASWAPYRTETFAEARDFVARLLDPGVLSR